MWQFVHQWDLAVSEWVGNRFFDVYWGWIARLFTDPKAMVGLCIVWLSYLAFFQRRKFRLGVALGVVSVLGTNTLSSEVLKTVVNRPRPCIVTSSPHFSTACQNQSPSFPSSHSANSMAFAVSQQMLGPQVFWPLVVLSILVGLSRIYVGDHYLFDVLAGWALGGVFSLLVIRLWENIREKFRRGAVPSPVDLSRKR